MFGPWTVWGVALVILLETGTIVASVLPGDSLLFLLGISLASTSLVLPVPVALTVVAIAAVVGSQIGYWIGRKLGASLWRRQKQTWFYNDEVVERTHAFFEKYGPRAVLMARFVPVLRALVPMFAGVSRMDGRKFTIYNVIGGLLWSVGITTAGLWLGHFAFVQKYLELCILGVVGLSALPILIELGRRLVPQLLTRSKKA